jgi:hypothetical protein
MVAFADMTLSEPGETKICPKQSRQAISRIQVYSGMVQVAPICNFVKHSLVLESFPLTCIYLGYGY